ncbi:hypothetical protein RHSIM_Rhsim05G0142000 [Rhododendron simsii]|uniref:DDE Tnp4 domain-containing protein n=1 Tax=Rhododendron simsii TaxID=118357 RepID=A0A834H7L1_RHOSS|nr:hypothetical protein RHSIM_Rhsim05G0142000 [Rhododendron simsii]
MQRAFEEVTATGSLQCTLGAEGELGMGADGRRALAIDNDDLTDTDGEGNIVGIENGEEIGSEYTSSEHGRGTPFCSQQGTSNPLFPQYGVMANLRWGNYGTPKDIGRGTFDFGNFTNLLETGVYPENDPIFNCGNGGNDLPNFNYPIVHQQSNELYQNGEGFGNMPWVNRFAITGQGNGTEAQAGYDNWEWMNNNNGNVGSSTNVFGDDADSEYSIPTDEFYAKFAEDELLVDLLTIALLHAIQILRMPQRLPFHTSSLSCKTYLHELMTSSDERHVHKILTCMRRGFTADKFKPTRRQDETHEYLDRRDIYKPFKGNCIGAIDGTHVMTRCKKKEDEKRFFSRKGYATQNIMAVCDFDLTFVFASVGWEGTYHDYSIFKRCVLNQRYRFPQPEPGKYYLVDAGYPNRPGFLALYKRLGFLALVPWYEMPTQVDLVLESMAIHNYVRRDREPDNFFASISSAYEYAFEDLPDEDPELEDRLDDRDDIVDEDNVPEMNDVRNNIRRALRRLRSRGNRVA